MFVYSGGLNIYFSKPGSVYKPQENKKVNLFRKFWFQIFDFCGYISEKIFQGGSFTNESNYNPVPNESALHQSGQRGTAQRPDWR